MFMDESNSDEEDDRDSSGSLERNNHFREFELPVRVVSIESRRGFAAYKHDTVERSFRNEEEVVCHIARATPRSALPRVPVAQFGAETVKLEHRSPSESRSPAKARGKRGAQAAKASPPAQTPAQKQIANLKESFVSKNFSKLQENIQKRRKIDAKQDAELSDGFAPVEVSKQAAKPQDSLEISKRKQKKLNKEQERREKLLKGLEKPEPASSQDSKGAAQPQTEPAEPKVNKKIDFEKSAKVADAPAAKTLDSDSDDGLVIPVQQQVKKPSRPSTKAVK